MTNSMIRSTMLGGAITVVSIRTTIIVQCCTDDSFVVDISFVPFTSASVMGSRNDRLKVRTNPAASDRHLSTEFRNMTFVTRGLAIIGVPGLLGSRSGLSRKFRKKLKVYGRTMKQVKVLFSTNTMGDVIRNGRNVRCLDWHSFGVIKCYSRQVTIGKVRTKLLNTVTRTVRKNFLRIPSTTRLYLRLCPVKVL